jgi:hypothetical protein
MINKQRSKMLLSAFIPGHKRKSSEAITDPMVLSDNLTSHAVGKSGKEHGGRQDDEDTHRFVSISIRSSTSSL